MIQFIDLSLRYGQNVLFDHLSWHIKKGSRISLVGPNGSGKTTLFKIAQKKQSPDSGNVVISKNTRISVFDQIPDFQPELSVLETAMAQNAGYAEYKKKADEIIAKMESTPHDSIEFENLLHKQSELEEFANSSGIHDTEFKLKKILSGLGFSPEQLALPTNKLSPGFQHRLALAIALFNPHNLLLLDEPTNHLDVEAKKWLAEYLHSSEEAFVLVSHDPEFMNETTNMIGELTSHGVFEFNGSLNEFLEEKNEIHAELEMQFKKEESFLNKRKEWIERFRSKATKAKQVQSQIKKLDKREKLARPDDIYWNQKTDYNFSYIPGSKLIAKLENASFKYNPQSNLIFNNADLEISIGDKIALVGQNGMGKSTLLNIFSGNYLLSDGKLTLAAKTVTGVFSQIHTEELDPSLALLDTVLKKYPVLAEVEARRILGFFSFSGDSVYKQISTLSGGEQSRLRLSMLVHHPCNLLLLDEPTNHLDLVARGSLKQALLSFPGAILIISHDPDFLSGLCKRTFKLENQVLTDCNVSYEEYIHSTLSISDGNKTSLKDAKNTADFQKGKADKNRLKKIQHQIQEIEKNIALNEKEKSVIETEMGKSDFYQTDECQNVLAEYESVKNKIASLMTEWETLEDELAKINHLSA